MKNTNINKKGQKYINNDYKVDNIENSEPNIIIEMVE